jgi:hypothetical protein
MKNFIILFLLLILSSSCLEDERIVNPIEPVAKDKDVVLTMQIPGTYLPVTYAYSENDENDIRTVDVLIFRVDASGNEYYYKHISAPAITQDNGNIKKTHLRLDFIDSRIIVLANVRHLFTTDMNAQLSLDSIQGYVTKETVVKRFVFDMKEPFGREREAIPMYGESGIIRSSDNVVNSITMIRSVTRIDIVNSILDDKVSVDSVYLFHTKDKGFVAPGFDPKGAMLEVPNVPVEAKANEKAFGYKFIQNAGVACLAMEREIYIAEDLQQSETPTIVVVKILREGHPPQFYRVDMFDKDGEMLSIQRNYRYRLNITKIISNGYLTAEEAAIVPEASLSSTVETNELGINTVVFNDQFKLGVSTVNIVFNADGSWEEKNPDEAFYSLKVHTTYSGWTAIWDSTELGDWLNFMDAKEADTSLSFPSTTLMLNMKASPNTTGKIRLGKIRLTAGTLYLEVKVTQDS